MSNTDGSYSEATSEKLDAGRRRILQQSLLGTVFASAMLGSLGQAAAQSNSVPGPGRTVRRVVTANNREGKSYFLKDETVKIGMIWTNDPSALLGQGASSDLQTLVATSVPRLDPPPGGAMLQFLSMPPSNKKPGEQIDKTLATNGAPNKDGYHRTSTLDYIYFGSGEVTLVLDGGETTLHAGDIVIQRNTSHAWRNYGTVPADLFVVNIRV